MQKISPFQAVVLAVFGVSIIGGLIILATTRGADQSKVVIVTIWGTIDKQTFDTTASRLTQNQGLKITYVEVPRDSFDQTLVEAIADGRGPDAILLPHDLLVREQGRIAPISYTVLPARTFKDTFIQEGELFLSPDGALAVPFSIDPLVMYWNRDMLTNAGIAKVPTTWNEFVTLVPKLSVKDTNLNILKSAVALGEFQNIANAKEIISALLMQTGNPIVGYGTDGLVSALAQQRADSVSALNFYTDFANPVKPSYSWNRALPNSLDMFTAGNLAFYFGFASEVVNVRAKNPNLNFDVTYFPQPKNAPVTLTYGRMHGIAVLKSTRNASAMIGVILALTEQPSLSALAVRTGLPSVRRDMLADNPQDAYQVIFNNSAIRARAWLDPNPLSTRTIFQDMIEGITSGEFEASKALDNAHRDLNNLLH